MIVYKTTNLINNKIYVGKRQKSKEYFEKSNYYGSGSLINKAIKKYGLENFKKEILEDNINDKKLLCEREIFWIKELNSLSPNGYNITKGGEFSDTISHHPRKKEIFENRTKNNPNMYKKIVQTRRNNDNYIMSDEQKKKLSINSASKRQEVKKIISEKLTGNINAKKKRILLNTNTNEIIEIEGLYQFCDFIKKYNQNHKINYHKRINVHKLRWFGFDKNFKIIDKFGVN